MLSVIPPLGYVCGMEVNWSEKMMTIHQGKCSR